MRAAILSRRCCGDARVCALLRKLCEQGHPIGHTVVRHSRGLGIARSRRRRPSSPSREPDRGRQSQRYQRSSLGTARASCTYSDRQPYQGTANNNQSERFERNGSLRQRATANELCHRCRRSGFAMIDDMAPLKQAMEQMDAEDPTAAQAAKDRAAQILSDAKLSFSKMAELIEQRQLLLRPRIVAGIKRMDQPGMLGDAAFRDTGSALRREGQSFRQIAEAIELALPPDPRSDTRIWRRRASRCTKWRGSRCTKWRGSRCTKWRASRVRPRG